MRIIHKNIDIKLESLLLYEAYKGDIDMLVQFKFKNYGSFKDEAVFDMRAIKTYKEHLYNVAGADSKLPILKVATVYGANASGKSTFVSAYRSFLDISKKSFEVKDKYGENNGANIKSILAEHYNPFRFSNGSDHEDSEFEATFLRDNIEYKYGFSYNDKRINYEWLYKKSINSGKRTKILERSPTFIELGASIKSACDKYKQDIADDCLALSFFSSLKIKTRVFYETLDSIRGILPAKLFYSESIDRLNDLYFTQDFSEKERIELLKFLKAIDVDIKDILVEKFNEKTVVSTFHENEEGDLTKIPFELESDGTQKAIAVFSLVKLAVKYGRGLIIDELNSQLHPLLLKYLVDFFYTEGTYGQLIFTTHNTSLLDKRYLRRDQIWFVDKKSGKSSLFSLSDFKPRNDASFEKEYLSGTFGAIPRFLDYEIEDEIDGE